MAWLCFFQVLMHVSLTCWGRFCLRQIKTLRGHIGWHVNGALACLRARQSGIQ
jgi:hypothetical protein